MKKEGLKKRLVIMAVILIVLILPMTSLISKAWLVLANLRLGSLSGVDKPSEFAIIGPYGVGGSDVQIDFISVNASTKNQVEGTNRKQYLFCVEGSPYITRYNIVIAHTTNVNFTYSLYMSDKVQSAVYSEAYSGQMLEEEFFYSVAPINFISLNRHDTNADLAKIGLDNVYYRSTYHDGVGGAISPEYVQENAMPIYEYAEIDLSGKVGYTGKQYYILNVTWEVEGSVSPLELKQKETDMVYVFVKTN